MPPELIVMVGESGSGKSYLAKKMVADSRDNMIRLNRDDLRSTLHGGSKSRRMEAFVTDLQVQSAVNALNQGLSVVVDDTNLNPKTRARWKEFSIQNHAEHREIRMSTTYGECVVRDAARTGTARVGEAVICRQFLSSGRLPIDRSKKIVIVDVDGTVANSDGIRSPYDESRVIEDNTYPVVVEWVRSLYEDRTVFFVSGRHSTCGTDTVEWFDRHNIPCHFLAMRHGWDNRSDVIVKTEILQDLLQIVDKSQIDFVLDDRPRVIEGVWKANGIKCYPVRGAVADF